MNNFYRLAQGIAVGPLNTALALNPQLWNQNKLRTTHPDSPHTEAEDIWLRFNEVKADPTSVIDDHESICYDAWYKLPQALPLIFDLMRAVNGIRLGRVMITKLKPGAKIAPHEDAGSSATYYKRFHIMLQNKPGSNFLCGEETVFMAPGETWYFDNQITHAVVNNSDDSRVTMIVDIRC